jgi:hypothetical protein
MRPSWLASIFFCLAILLASAALILKAWVGFDEAKKGTGNRTIQINLT